MTNAPTDLVGQTLGPYAIEQLLGQGGFAWVFAAREKDGTPVAVKVLKPRYANDPQFAPRFRNEAKTASQLEHPNIIRIRSVGESDGHSYFSMDLCADGLGLRIAREGPLPEADLVRIGKDLAGALEFAHAQGIIHRDIKADNVLLRSDGSAVLTDFGIARTVSGYATSTGVDMTIGTPNYISPEQAQGRPVDPRGGPVPAPARCSWACRSSCRRPSRSRNPTRSGRSRSPSARRTRPIGAGRCRP